MPKANYSYTVSSRPKGADMAWRVTQALVHVPFYFSSFSGQIFQILSSLSCCFCKTAAFFFTKCHKMTKITYVLSSKYSGIVFCYNNSAWFCDINKEIENCTVSLIWYHFRLRELSCCQFHLSFCLEDHLTRKLCLTKWFSNVKTKWD